MDTKTLLVAAFVISMVSSLSMFIVFWTRRTYAGFGYWLAGIVCRVIALVLSLLPSDQFPLLLSIVTADCLLLAELNLYRQGMQLFRGQSVRYAWEIAALLSFFALLVYFTYVAPSLNARIVLTHLCYAAWIVEVIRVLMTRRPPYFGSIDRCQACVLALLAAGDLVRAVYVWAYQPPLQDYLSNPAIGNYWLLFMVSGALLLAFTQVIMNAQRLEYDLRLSQEQLQQEMLSLRKGKDLLRLSESRYRLLAENTQDVIWTMAIEGNITYISPAVEQVRGLTPEEAMRQPLEEILTADSQAITLGYFARLHAAIAAGLPPPEKFHGELEYLHKDGTPLWAEVTSFAIQDPDGRVVEILGVTRDISKRKAAEDAAKANELKMRRILDNIPTPVWALSMDPEGQFLFTNDQFVRTFGYVREDMPTVGDWERRAYPDAALRAVFAAWWQQAVAEAVRVKGEVESRELRITCKDGSVKDAIVSAASMEDMLLVSLLDITERRSTEERLRVSEERHRLWADHSVDIIWTMTLDGAITYISPSVERLLGYTPEEWMSFSTEERFAASSCAILAEILARAFANVKAGLSIDFSARELEQRHKDGTLIWVEITASGIYDQQGRFLEFIGITRDISIRKQNEHELEQARDAITAANQALYGANAELQKLATTDPLTGVWNRRHFEDAVQREITRSQRYGEPLSLLLFDIDHFKAINDRCGHLTGDRVLVELARRVRTDLRSEDWLARWGGEEFVVLMPHCRASEGLKLAQKLRLLVAERCFDEVGAVTISVGAAELQRHEALDLWFKRVDEALYRAKDEGRNRVVLAEASQAAGR